MLLGGCNSTSFETGEQRELRLFAQRNPTRKPTLRGQPAGKSTTAPDPLPRAVLNLFLFWDNAKVKKHG